MLSARRDSVPKIPTESGNYLMLMSYEIQLTFPGLSEMQLEAKHRHKCVKKVSIHILQSTSEISRSDTLARQPLDFLILLRMLEQLDNVFPMLSSIIVDWKCEGK